MLLEFKHHPGPACNENFWHTTFLHLQHITKRIHYSSIQQEIGTAFPTKLYVHPLLNTLGPTSHHKLPPRYSTYIDERVSYPFHAELWTLDIFNLH